MISVHHSACNRLRLLRRVETRSGLSRLCRYKMTVQTNERGADGGGQSAVGSTPTDQNLDHSQQPDHLTLDPLPHVRAHCRTLDKVNFSTENALKLHLQTALIQQAKPLVRLLSKVKRQIDVRFSTRIATPLRPEQINRTNTSCAQIRRDDRDLTGYLRHLHIQTLSSISSNFNQAV